MSMSVQSPQGVEPSPSPRGLWGRVKAWFKPAPKKYTSTQMINIMSATGIVFIVFFMWLESTWKLNITPTEVKCLPYTAFVVSQSKPEVLEKGKIYVYGSRGLMPLLPDGSNMGKILAGLPGDEVQVDAEGIHINGELWGPLNKGVMERSGKSLTSIATTYIIPEGKALMLGTLERSYDGRYWGLIDQKDIRGRAYPIW